MDDARKPRQASLFARIEAAEGAADHAGQDWCARAFALLVRYAETHDRFLIEDVRAGLDAMELDAPPDERASGGIAMAAMRQNIIERDGLTHDQYASQKHIWKSLIVKDQAAPC